MLPSHGNIVGLKWGIWMLDLCLSIHVSAASKNNLTALATGGMTSKDEKRHNSSTGALTGVMVRGVPVCG
jgi:hypothetical protein